MYAIRVDFTTGDSFHTEDTSVTLDWEWKDAEKVRDALLRIRGHWRWYDYVEKHEPEWHKGLGAEQVVLVLDNGEPVTFRAPWCGFFERLNSAEAVLGPSMKIEV